MKKNMKLLTLALAAVMSISVLAGCTAPSQTNSNSGSNPSATSPNAKEPVTITIWHTRPESDEPTSNHQRFLAWADNYNSTNTDNIKVEIVGSKKDDAILTAIASGTTPDIFMGLWNTTSTWAANGALLNLTDYINNDAAFEKDDFASVGWDQATFDGGIYGVPFIMNTTLLYYRMDLLKEAGYDAPPKTIEELKDMAINLTKYDDKGNITQAGFMPNHPWLDNVCWPVMTGADWIDTTTNKITFDSPEIKEAYQWQADICKEIGYDKTLAFKEGFGTRDTAEDPVITGKVAMMFYSELKLPAMQNLGKDIEWGVVALPYGSNAGNEKEIMLTTNQFKINANTANPDAAWKVLSDLCGKESYTSFAEGEFGEGAFYGRKSAVQAVKDVPNISDQMIQVADIMLSGTGRGFPNSAYVNEYLTIINEQMSLTLSGDLTVEEGVKEVQKQVQPLADKNPMK